MIIFVGAAGYNVTAYDSTSLAQEGCTSHKVRGLATYS